MNAESTYASVEATDAPMDVEERVPEADGDVTMSMDKKIEFGEECEILLILMLHLNLLRFQCPYDHHFLVIRVLLMKEPKESVAHRA